MAADDDILPGPNTPGFTKGDDKPDIIIDPDLQGSAAGAAPGTAAEAGPAVAPIAVGGDHPVIDKPDVLISPDVSGQDQPQQKPPAGFDYKEPGLMSRVWRFVTGEGKSDPSVPSTFSEVQGTTAGSEATKDLLLPMSFEPGATSPAALVRQYGKSDAQREQETPYQNLIKLYAMNARPDQLYEAALKIPGAEAMPDDAQGNKRVKINGKPTYIAPPGLGAQDVVGTLGEGAIMAAAAMAPEMALPALAARGFLPAAARMAIQPLTQMGATYATGKAIEGAGGGTGASDAQILNSGIFGLGGAVAGNLARTFFANWRGAGSLYTNLDGLQPTDIIPSDRLTETGRQMIQLAGLDARNLTVQDLRNAQTIAGTAARHIVQQGMDAAPGTRTTAQVVMDASRFRPPGETPPFPMTTGELSQDPMQLLLEERLRKAGPAAADMQNFRGVVQRNARLDEAARLVPGVGSLDQLPSEELLGQRIRQAVRDQSDRLHTDTGNAYTTLDSNLTAAGHRADPTMRTLQFSSDPSTAILRDLHGVTDSGYNADTMPVATRALGVVSRLISNTPDAVTGSVGNLATRQGAAQTVRGFNLGDLVQTQRTLGQMIRDMPVTPENAAERRILYRLQDAVENRSQAAQQAGQTSGDGALWGDYQNARDAARREFAFTRPRSSDAAYNFVTDANNRNLDLTGQQVSDRVFGKDTQIGGSGNTPQILQHLQPNMAPGDYESIRQLAARRVLMGGKEADADSALRTAQRVREAVGSPNVPGSGQPAIMGRVQTPAEAFDMQRYAQLMTAANPPVIASSPTAPLMEELSRLRSAAVKFPGAGSYLRRLSDERLIEQARRAQTGLLNPENFPNVRLPPSMADRVGGGAARILPAAGGLLGTDYRRQ